MEERQKSDRLCECGCGEYTYVMDRNNRRLGWVKGEAFRFIARHNARLQEGMAWGPSLWREEDRGFASPCHIFLHAHDRNGYGIFANRNRIGSSRLAHRESYLRHHGSIPDGKDIDHLCRQPSCINPDHLEAVPHRENLRRGKNTKLTQEQANEIRRLYAENGGRKKGQLRYRDLAEMFGVEKRTIWEIVKGRRWH